MEEIKVGDFIRTSEDGIYKIKNYELGNRLACVYSDDRHVYNYPKNEFLNYKHSFNIKDLIQAGDIVIYKLYKFSKFYDIELVREYTDARTQKKYLGVKGFRLKESQIEIKEILTKEQFNQMKYIVGGE